MTEEEKAAKEAAKAEEKAEETTVAVKEKAVVEVATVEILYKMRYNVLHNGVQYKAGEVVPAELVDEFTEKGFVDKELKEL